MKTLRLILGDQLNIKHSWFKETDDTVIYCMMEVRQETDYTRHHIQKITGFFAAMRQFGLDIKKQGHQIIYLKINDRDNLQDITKNLHHIIEAKKINHFEYLFPDEYRLDQQLHNFSASLHISSSVVTTEHFYTSRTDLATFFQGKKQFVMENFYRSMRRKHAILMVADQPEGGQWNYDKSNRNKWDESVEIPPEKNFDNEVSAILKDIETSKIKTIGKPTGLKFTYPITRSQALEQLKYFCQNLLMYFGDFQDAMHTQQAYLFHSRLSFAMNLKLLSPKDVVATIMNYYKTEGKDIDISQVEGFIRQVIGWREYMRGMYWALMPNFKKDNKLDNNNKLPDFFWTGDTKMECLKQSITNSINNSYAHHIQRLMITGNYALLTQTHPDAVDDWYLGIYIDAVEWVQITNTRGMSQFADGGKIATKPYISSGSYIHKMSNYCSNCHYNKTKKTEDDACPFNSLYWNFLDEKRPQLEGNFRMRMMYRLLDKMNPEAIEDMKTKAQHIIKNPNAY